MTEEHQGDDGSLYARVLQRLSLALKEAERVATVGGGEVELEVGGLTPAEFALIRAYLQQDTRWLSGWHAAAEEHAQIVRLTTRSALRDLRQRPGKASKQAAPTLRRMLICAICGAPVDWPETAGPAACSACGSQLLRARQRLHTYPKH